MRFASHRDIARAVERGVRKAGLPVAYSAGFSPHPKISYAGGAPTGSASEAEYLEIALTGVCAGPDVRDRLDAALPDGIDVIEVLELAPGGSGALRLEASQWQVTLPGVTPGEADRAVQAFLATDHVEVERLTSKGLRRLDARAAVVTLELDRRAAQDSDAGCATLRMVVRHLTPAVRPDDVLAALSSVAALVPASPPLVTRLAQGPLGVEADIEGAHGGTAAEALLRPEPARPAATGQVPGPLGHAAAQRQETETRWPGAAAAVAAPPASAYEQLPRGALGPDAGPRAREYDGRLPGCSTASLTTGNQTTMGRPRPAAPTR
jgi:radical SAM-linked protein